ncbi:hypothetical protein HSRCO_1622 [Halanaeroarchaeum sp. HSR-CO]|uniref:hypothetical protein n=1 Tax=Halanaeroarchaeum sp. HSR-CO TaxID=2866382 RepID=UPI00217D43BA|nr:hypothetical protein [Halanaeroarchaeum sp. HSR-CO]UWG47901.1 hypothetical protein HSRCO_1622 [Halanaeroarchaeum sp. HSR-CO]
MTISQYQKGYADGKRETRDRIIKRMHEDGLSQSQIAGYVYISRQRVNQIVNDEPETRLAQH